MRFIGFHEPSCTNEFGVKKCKISFQCTNNCCHWPTDPYGQIISEVLFAVSTPALAQNLASSVSAEAESIASDQLDTSAGSFWSAVQNAHEADTFAEMD